MVKKSWSITIVNMEDLEAEGSEGPGRQLSCSGLDTNLTPSELSKDRKLMLNKAQCGPSACVYV